MGSTMTYQLRSPPTLDRGLSRYSNTAGAPLPLIPRRLPVSRSQSYPSHCTIVRVHPPSPSEKPRQTSPKICTLDDSDSTSTSSISDHLRTVITPRPRRIRGQRSPLIFPPGSSPPSIAAVASHPLKGHLSPCGDEGRDDTTFTQAPDIVLDTDAPALQADRHQSPPSSDTPSVIITAAPPHLEITIPPNVETKLIRKKSGQLVKSSLKSAKSQDRGSLSVVTRGLSTKSEPATPTHSKAVKFDSQLEHVKLFLAEQKPLAVSRDGSPTTDTSGTDNDFPSFIYGVPADAKNGDLLSMNTVNMPAKPNPNADVVLTELKLSQDMMTIIGTVRVRNISYHKWIAVRFTFDSWQTTSEVAARHTHTLQGGEFDTFTFTIRLNDLWSRIETKTLILAIRYTVSGREIWDNNGGHNYVTHFTKSKSTRLHKPDDASSGDDVANHLVNRLEDVVRKEGSHVRRGTPAEKNDKPPVFKELTSLSSRYDLSASFKTAWKPPTLPPLDTRNSIPWPQKATPTNDRKPTALPIRKNGSSPRGSPRDVYDDDRSTVHIACDGDGDGLPFHRNRTGRNHQRSYFDFALSEPGNLRRTPPGTPVLKSVDDNMAKSAVPSIVEPDRLLPADNSFVNQRSMGWRRDSADSEDSTPSIVSPASSSRSTSPSPTEPTDTFMMNCMTVPHPDHVSDSSADYSRFLNTYVQHLHSSRCNANCRRTGFASIPARKTFQTSIPLRTCPHALYQRRASTPSC